jgi:tetratricopeptide (TPR) repeat protein
VRQYGPLLTKYKQYDKAIDLYERALAAVPEDAKLFQLLGRAQAAKGSVDQAITSYESAIRLNDKAADVHIDLATAYFARKDMKGVIAEIEKAVKLDPKNFDLYMTVGEMCALSNDWDNAALYYRIAAHLRPTAAEPFNNVGFVLTRKAIYDWQHGDAKSAKEKILEAKLQFGHAIQLKPDFESAKKNLTTATLVETKILTKPPPATAPAAASQPTK